MCAKLHINSLNTALNIYLLIFSLFIVVVVFDQGPVLSHAGTVGEILF